MDHGNRNRRLRCAAQLLAASLTALLLASCGGSTNDATQLLRQTFTGNHEIKSGNLGFTVTLVPSGASALRGPISLSLGGPFQSLGSGKLPASAFNLSLGTSGGTASVTITSTGTTGYVTFQGQSYRLPQATFQRLESSFSALGSTSGSGSGSGVLAKLGIQPEHWLVNPQVVGDEAIGGTDTTHVRAGINVAALLTDLNTFLERASSLGVSGARSLSGGISAATRNRIASEVQNPSFDVWTGKDDKTLRRLQIKLNLALTGQGLALLGRSAGLGITMQYADLNQPQTITPPGNLQPYSEFQNKLRVLVEDLQGALADASIGGSGTTRGGASSGGSTASGAGSNYQSYSNCIQAAGSDIAKMQQCAPLLNGK
jgi:hypothetical protein